MQVLPCLRPCMGCTCVHSRIWNHCGSCASARTVQQSPAAHTPGTDVRSSLCVSWALALLRLQVCMQVGLCSKQHLSPALR